SRGEITMLNRKQTRRDMLKLTAAAGLSSAALQMSPVVRAQDKPSGKIVFAIWADAVEDASWDPIVAAFNKHQPDIEVEVQAVPAESWSGFFDAVSTRIAGGQVPDVMRVATEGQRLFASRGLV